MESLLGKISNEDKSAIQPPNGDGGSGINTPDLDKNLKPKRRAVTSVEQLNNIVSTLEMAARSRNEKNGRILAKYNAERPYEADKLRDEGLEWKNNFSTKPLASAIDKIPPRLCKAVHAARSLTSAHLPASIDGAKVKTEKFRSEITKTIRNWPEWRSFINSVAFENAVFGFEAVAWLDKYSWKPINFRQDRFFVPDQTKQESSACQLVVLRQELQIFELFNLIEDEEAAKAAGWDLEACIETINAAAPKSAINVSAPYTEMRTYQDALRESAVYLSMQQGAKVIEINHIFVAEADGKVSYYCVDHRDSKKLLRQELDQYESMEEVVRFFSYQHATGLLMGSKGIGRELFEIASAVDRARNELADRLSLAGKAWLQAPAKTLDRLKLSVVGNMVLVPEGVTVVDVKIDSGANEYQQLDNLLTGLMDQIAGSTTPRQLQGERVTATQVNVYTAREQERPDDITERFLLQLAGVVTEMQKRICDPATDDKAAKLAREELLRYMTEEELADLAKQPAATTVEDWTEAETQDLVIFGQEKRNDPLYDQVKLARMVVAARFGAEVAEDIILPENDPTQEAEQARAQTIENLLLSTGRPIPVSSRDAHRIHADVLKAEIPALAQQLAQDPSVAPAIKAMVDHWQQHAEAAINAGDKPSNWAEDTSAIQQVGAALAPVMQPSPEEAAAQGISPEELAEQQPPAL